MALDETLTNNQVGHTADHEALRVEHAGRGVTITPVTSKASHKSAHNDLHANHNLIGAPTSLPQDPTTGHLAHHNALHAAYNTRITPMPDPVGQSAGIWTGVWRDEFDTGTKPDTAVWADHLIEGAEHRTNWNVDEIQWYTHDKRGLSIASSILTLTARHESPYTADPLCPNPLPSGNVGTYTSGAIQSHPGFQMSYGYLEARIRPGAAGVGQWPAFWTFGSDVGWPPEFDIAEFNGTFIRYNYFENDGTLHGTGDVAFAPDGNFHTWGLLWNPTQVRFYRNGTQVHSFNGTITSIPQHVILNFAVRTGATGGPWTWDVDYVRAWKLNGSPAQPVITSITPSNGIPSAGTIQVSFGAVSGATSYRVSAGPTDSVEDVVDTSNIHRANTGSASPITVSGLQNGARYNVTVAAINATGYSIESLPVPAYT